MKSFTFTLILAATLLAVAFAAPEPEPEPAKGKYNAYHCFKCFHQIVMNDSQIAPRFRAAQIIDEDGNDEVAGASANADDNQGDIVVEGNKKGEASSGRLFMKKFLLFKNMFGNNQKQPVIPIIITGGGGGATTTTTGTSPPTTTITSTGTVPTATGTITTSPATGTGGTGGTADAGTADAGTADAGAGAGARRPLQRIQLLAARGSYDNNNEEQQALEDQETVVDNQALAAALAAGAEEYVVTDQDISGTSDNHNENGAARVNLRRRGNKKGKVVSVRVPPKYRGYFKNGQRVILNNGNRFGGKRRVIKKRVVRKRNKKNKITKRRRVIGRN